MKRKRFITALILIIFALSLTSVHFASATSRKDLLASFCVDNQDSSGGFFDTNNATSNEIDVFTSFANIFILYQIDPKLEMLNDQIRAQTWFKDKFSPFTFDGNTIPIIEATYSYMGCELLNKTINSTTLDKAVTNMIGLEENIDDDSAGFASSEAEEINIVDTYLAVKFLNITGNLDLIDTEKLQNFVLSCWDNDSKAFGGSPNAGPTLADSYYALDILNRIEKLDVFIAVNGDSLNTFVESFYCDDLDSYKHYGGYSYSDSYIFSSIVSTYYSTSIKNLIGASLHAETLTWLLARQNSYDYGFCDVSKDGSSGVSSAKLSYYAVSSILIFDSEAFENNIMNEELHELDTNGWIVAAIWLGIIGALAILGYGIYRYKTRI